LELTDEGFDVLRSRRPISLTRPVNEPKAGRRRRGEIACDEALFQELRDLRKRIADARGVPPYVVFGDVSLREMSREYPQTRDEFRAITGVGEHKLREFAEPFLEAIREHLRRS